MSAQSVLGRRRETRNGPQTRSVQFVVGTKIAKRFPDDKLYFGQVTAVYKDDNLWHVKYDDDSDEEDLNLDELKTACRLYCEETCQDVDDNDDDYSP